MQLFMPPRVIDVSKSNSAVNFTVNFIQTLSVLRLEKAAGSEGDGDVRLPSDFCLSTFRKHEALSCGTLLLSVTG